MLGFRGLGFRGLGLRGLGLRVLGRKSAHAAGVAKKSVDGTTMRPQICSLADLREILFFLS